MDLAPVKPVEPQGVTAPEAAVEHKAERMESLPTESGEKKAEEKNEVKASESELKGERKEQSAGLGRGSHPELSNNVYLWGIPTGFTERDLRLLMFACGTVVSVRMGNMTTKPQTYAFVQFSNEEEAMSAVQLLNSRRLNGREIVVRFAKPPPVSGPRFAGTPVKLKPMHGEPPAGSRQQHIQPIYNNGFGLAGPAGIAPYEEHKGPHFAGYPIEMYPMHFPTGHPTGTQGGMMAMPTLAQGGHPHPHAMGMAGMPGINAMGGIPSMYPMPPMPQHHKAHGGSRKSLPLSTTNIYISGLPKSVNKKLLEDMFSQYGSVVSTKVILNRHTGDPLGTALVRMETNLQAQASIKGLNGYKMDGSTGLSCRFANEKKRKGGHSHR